MANDLLLKAKARRRRAESETSTDTDPYSAENLTGAAFEPMMALGSGMVAAPVSGLAGLGSMATNALGVTDVDPADVVRDVGGAMTYQPQTSGGKIANQAITYPFRKMEEGADYLGGKTAEVTNPATGAIVKSALLTAPMLLGAKSGGKMSNETSFIPQKLNNTISSTAKFIPKTIGKGTGIVKNAIMSRLPGGARQAAADTTYEMLGDRSPSVIEALTNAESKQTAGQAAVKSGAYELSALQKAMEERHPSKYGAIHESQQRGRMQDLESIKQRPIDLENADKFRAGESKPLYNEGRSGVVKGVDNIVRDIDKIIKDNPGNKALITGMREVRRGLVTKKGKSRTSAQEVLSTADGLKTLIGNKDFNFVKQNLRDIQNKIIELSPKYKAGQETYARLSKPVNQMQVGEVLADALDPRLGSNERASTFANAKANAPLTIKKATKEPRFKKLAEVLTEQQMKKVDKVGNELNRDATMDYQARKANRAMNERMGTMFDIPKVGILERSIVIANALLKKIEGKNTKAAFDILSKEMENPQTMAALLKEANPAQKAVIMKSIEKYKNQVIVGGAVNAAQENN